jgi:hypothetical protein
MHTQVSWSPGLSEVLQQVEAKFPSLKANGASSEDFIKLIRAQVRARVVAWVCVGVQQQQDCRSTCTCHAHT